jgi:hypothetical protein
MPLAFEPVFQVTGVRKSGRPKGSKVYDVQDACALGVHRFAHVQHRREALQKHTIDAGRHLHTSLAPHAKITQLLDLLSSDASAKPAALLPSEWVQSECMTPRRLV